jgi:hypothetical protein
VLSILRISTQVSLEKKVVKEDVQSESKSIVSGVQTSRKKERAKAVKIERGEVQQTTTRWREGFIDSDILSLDERRSGRAHLLAPHGIHNIF